MKWLAVSCDGTHQPSHSKQRTGQPWLQWEHKFKEAEEYLCWATWKKHLNCIIISPPWPICMFLFSCSVKRRQKGHYIWCNTCCLGFECILLQNGVLFRAHGRACVCVCEYNTICYNLITWALSSAISWFGIILSDGSHLRSSPWLYEAKVSHFCSAILKHNFMPFRNGLLMPLKSMKEIWLQKESKAMCRWVNKCSLYCSFTLDNDMTTVRGQQTKLLPTWFCATINVLQITWNQCHNSWKSRHYVQKI